MFVFKVEEVGNALLWEKFPEKLFCVIYFVLVQTIVNTC